MPSIPTGGVPRNTRALSKAFFIRQDPCSLVQSSAPVLVPAHERRPMPHPKRLPVRQLFRLLDEQLQTPQRDVAAHLGLSRQAVNNWAMGMSLPQHYRQAFVDFVDTKIGAALARAQARSLPTRTLLEMTPFDATHLNIKTALDMWRDEIWQDRGGLAEIWRQNLHVLNVHGKDPETMPTPTPAVVKDAVKQLIRFIRTRDRLATEPSMPLHERWGAVAGTTNVQEYLWSIYLWATREQDGEPEHT